MTHVASERLYKLDAQFSENLKAALQDQVPLFEEIELLSRGVAEISRVLPEQFILTTTQKELSCLFNEVFADLVISIYFAASGLDNPAQLMLRRSLEMGVAIVFLWDQPHYFYAWRDYSADLSFTEMVKFLQQQGYRQFVMEQNAGQQPPELIDSMAMQILYGELSDTVHGKLATLETRLSGRYKYDSEEWTIHLERTKRTSHQLYKLWTNRFNCLADLLCKSIPALEGCIRRV